MGFKEIAVLWIDIAWSFQKLGILLENKVPPNLKLSKAVDLCQISEINPGAGY